MLRWHSKPFSFEVRTTLHNFAQHFLISDSITKDGYHTGEVSWSLSSQNSSPSQLQEENSLLTTRKMQMVYIIPII